jgi:hypothetical protein
MFGKNGKTSSMEKEFVPYELALRMKALGFKERCIMHWWKGKLSYYQMGDFSPTHTSAPTYSQAFRWFREKYGLYCGFNEPKSIKIRLEHNTFEIIRKESDEEAETACLEKLLEIVEEEYGKEK